MRRIGCKKRSLFNVPFTLADGLVVGMNSYSCYSIKKVPGYRYLYYKTNEPVQIVSSHICEITGQEISPRNDKEVEYFYSCGGKRIIFTVSELLDIRKKFGASQMELLGFKNITCLSLYHNLSHSTFLFPTDNIYVGSTRIVSSMIQSMHKKGKYALVRLQARSGSTPSWKGMMMLGKSSRPDFMR